MDKLTPVDAVLTTDRLALRHLDEDDAPFILELLNDPAWLKYIGDRGVRTLDDARGYIRSGPLAMYERCGHGLYAVVDKAGGTPMGLCGLIKRETLEDVDIGFAFLPRYCGQGYACEAAAATMRQARHDLGLERVVAITAKDNATSIRLLGKLGFRFERMIQLGEDAQTLRLFGWQA